MNALVTGGGGFLGSAIVRLLRARGDAVRSLARGEYPELDALGVEQVRGDVADADAVLRAVDGCDVVFHTAAKAGIWGPYEEYYRTNLEGTRNVVAACKVRKVRRLVYTSSPSVVFDGRDVEGANESAPYASRFESAYAQTKALAERLVLEGDGDGLSTVALRPHLIWGPGDHHLIPRLIARARAGRLRKIGRRDPMVDSTYIDNAAEAHLLAADRLRTNGPASGRAYFLSQGEPRPLWNLINGILATAGIAPVTRSIPRGLAFFAASACEAIYRTLHLSGEPPMTRFLAQQLSCAHWFDIRAARRDLGYRPIVSIDEGLIRLEKAFRQPS